MANVIDLAAEREEARRRAVASPAFTTGDHVELAAATLNQLGPAEYVASEHRVIYGYDPGLGIWVESDKDELSRIVQSFSGAPVYSGDKSHPLKVRANDVTGTLTLAASRVAKPGLFNDAPMGLAFRNGFLRVFNGGIDLVPHAAEHGARHSYPFAYDAAAVAPRWERFLGEVFAGDEDGLEKAAALQEIAGASLLGLITRFERCLFLYGNGSNGKSVALEVLEGCFPEGSRSAIAPQTWGNEYRCAELANRMINVVHELPEADIMAAENFKAIISGQPVEARRIRESPFRFRPRAGHLFSANRLPSSNDQSDGFWRRMMVLEFNRVFRDEDKDFTLATGIIRDELKGVVAWLVAGARRLLQTGRVTDPPSSIRAVKAWRHGSDPVSLFVSEKTRAPRSTLEREHCRSMFDAYATWAEASRFKTMSIASFGRRMAGLGYPSIAADGERYYPLALLRAGEKPDPEPVAETPRDPAEDWER